VSPATATAAAPALAFDPAVPGRDVLLDGAPMPDRLARLLALAGQLAIGGYRRVRARYRVGESLRLVHELEIGGTPRLVAGRTFAGRSADVYERARERAAARRQGRCAPPSPRTHPRTRPPRRAWTRPAGRSHTARSSRREARRRFGAARASLHSLPAPDVMRRFDRLTAPRITLMDVDQAGAGPAADGVAHLGQILDDARGVLLGAAPL
jgi:hypothetical protein